MYLRLNKEPSASFNIFYAFCGHFPFSPVCIFHTVFSSVFIITIIFYYSHRLCRFTKNKKEKNVRIFNGNVSFYFEIFLKIISHIFITGIKILDFWVLFLSHEPLGWFYFSFDDGFSFGNGMFSACLTSSLYYYHYYYY